MAFTDNFNRASLGANWATVLGTAWVTVSSLYLKPAGPYELAAVQVVGTFNTDQYAEVWTEVPSGAGDVSLAGPAVRMNGTGDCYYVRFGLANVGLYKQVSGADTYLGDSNFSPPIAADTLAKVRLVVTGTLLEIFVAGVSVLALTDGTHSTGNPGCFARTGQTSLLPRFDDFASTDLSVGGGGGSGGARRALMGAG